MSDEKTDICDIVVVHKKAVEAARKVLPDEPRLARLADFFKVATDPTRLKILYALGWGELCVCDLAATTGSSVSSVSHHLVALRRARLVKPRRAGRVIYYSLDDMHIHGILAMARDHLEESHD